LYAIGLWFVFFVMAVIRWAWFVFANFYWIFFLFAIYWAGGMWTSYSTPITEISEEIWRCDLYPIWDLYFRQFFQAMVVWWTDGICWWNAIGLIERLFSGKLMWDIYEHCENGFNIWAMITDLITSLVYLLSTYMEWFFAADPVENVFPIYPWYRLMGVLIFDMQQMIACACEDLRIFTEWFGRVAESNNLSCMLSQATNAFMNVLQTIVSFAIQCIGIFFDMISTHPGDTNYFVALLSGQVPGFELPSMLATTERTAAVGVYAGAFLNEALKITICTGMSEIESIGNVTDAVEVLYPACMANASIGADLFCFLGPLVGGFYRLERLGFQLVLNVPRILYEMSIAPSPPPLFLTDEWMTDVFYDTMRFPPPAYNYCRSVNFPAFVPGSNHSTIVPLNPLLYGNYTDVDDVACNASNVSRFVIPCRDCPLVEEFDMVSCLCNTSVDLDALIAPYVSFKVFGPSLCCLIGNVVVVMTDLLKFAQDLVVHVIMIHTFSSFITDQNNFDAPIDAMIGPYYKIGGLLDCPRQFLVGFDPRLGCLATFVANPFKAVGEVFRLLVDSSVRALNDVYGTGCLGLFDVICTSKPTCFDLEIRVFQYLRRPRDPFLLNDTFSNGTLYPIPNYNDTYVPINTTFPLAWAECACELISFSFLNQFLAHPAANPPDFCCGLYYGFRFILEAIKGLTEMFFAAFETVVRIFEPSQPLKLTVLGFVACQTIENCAPIAQMLSDLLDFMDCPCLFVEAIDDGINAQTQEIPCVCLFFNSIAKVFYYLVTMVSLAAQVTVELVDCILSNPPFPGPYCTDVLLSRVDGIFAYYKLVILALADLVSTIGCVLGLLFRFDCLGTRYFSPPDYPPCTQGSSPGVCAAGDRLERFFRDLFLVIVAIPNFFVKILKEFALLAFSLPWTGFSDISTLVLDFLLALGNPFFGDSMATPVETTGLLQSAGLLFNCLIGPPTSDCINEPVPSLADPNSAGNCIGDILVVVGDGIRDIYDQLAALFASVVGIIGALFGHNAALLQTSITNFITGLFNLLVVVLGSLGQLITTIINIITAVVSYIFGSGVGAVVNFFLTIASGPAKILLTFFGNVISHNGMKRFFDVRYLYAISLGSSKDATEMYDRYAYNPFSLKALNDSALSMGLYLSKHFGTLAAETTFENGTKARWYDDIHSYSESVASRLTGDENRKRAMDDVPLENLDFAAQTETMQRSMTNGTLCKRAMDAYGSYDSLESMSLPDQLVWNFCFFAYVVPVTLNAVFDHGPQIFDLPSDAAMPFRVPEDVFYNPATFFSTAGEIFETFQTYSEWSQLVRGPAIGTDDVVIYKQMPDWFLESQKEARLSTVVHANSTGNYLYEEDETWERVDDRLLFINLPGESVSVPVIDGRYPTLTKNVTFAEHLADKGLSGDVAQSLGSAMATFDRTQRENKVLRIFSHVRDLASKFTPNFTFYASNFTDGRYDPRQWDLGRGGGLLDKIGGTTWQKLFRFGDRDPRPSTPAASSRAKRTLESADWEGAKRSIERGLNRIGGFGFHRYLFSVVPDSLYYLYERIANGLDVQRLVFDVHLEDRHGANLSSLSDRWETTTPIHLDRRSDFSRTWGNVDPETGGDFYLPFVTSLDREKRIFDRRRSDVSYPEDRNVTKTTTYHLGEYGATHREELKNRTLIGHRLEMIKEVAYGFWKRFLDEISLANLLSGFKRTHLDPYAKIYSDTLRVHKRRPSLHGPYALAFGGFHKTSIAKSGLFKYFPQWWRDRDSEFHRFMNYGHEGYDDRDYDSTGPSVATESRYSMSKKRQIPLAPPEIPICLPGAPELACDFCEQCPTEQCDDCKACQNCTQFLDGSAQCDSCAVCTVGGPDCRQTCTGCTNCSMVDSTCLNCRIIEILFSSAVDEVAFCVALAHNDTSVIKKPPPNVTLIKLFYYSDPPTGNYTVNLTATFQDFLSRILFVDILPHITDLDIPSTLVYFFKNENQNPFKNSVGLLFFLRRWIHVPTLRQCNRDIDLQCTFGHGLEEGITIALIVCLVLGAITWFVFPPVAGLVTGLIVTMGWILFFFTLVLSLSWFFNPYCLVSPSTFIYSFIFPQFPILPLFPSCAAQQIYDLLNKFILPCYGFPYSLTTDGITCPTCPNKLNVVVCQDFGFTNQFVQIGYLLQRYALPVNDYLNSTCLVQGGCLFGLTSDIGPLKPFFDYRFNITYITFPNGTQIPTNGTNTLDSCFWFQLPSVMELGLWIFLLFLGLVLVAEILPPFLFMLRYVFALPPLSLFVPWPFVFLLDQEVLVREAFPGSYLYNKGERSGEGKKAKKRQQKKKKKKEDDKKSKKKSTSDSKKKGTVRSKIEFIGDAANGDEDSSFFMKPMSTTVRNRKRKDADFSSDSGNCSDSSTGSDSDESIMEESRYVGFLGTMSLVKDSLSGHRRYQRKKKVKTR
jgi:hypothetical protein